MSRPFDDTADTYAETVDRSIEFAGQEHAYYLRRKADHLIEMVRMSLGDPAGLRALDVGAGSGSMERHLRGVFGSLVACDPSIRSIAGCARGEGGIERLAADGMQLPFRDGSFDVALVVNVLHHVEPTSRGRLVGELHRVVGTGGLVALFEHNPLNPLTRLAVDRCPFDEGVRLLGRRELCRLLTTAGFEVDQHRYIVFTPFDRPVLHRIERRLHRVPLGAQHVVVAHRRTPA